MSHAFVSFIIRKQHLTAVLLFCRIQAKKGPTNNMDCKSTNKIYETITVNETWNENWISKTILKKN